MSGIEGGVGATGRRVAGTAVRRMRAAWAHWSGRSRRERAALDGSRAVILMYHRVLPRAQARHERVEPAMYVDPETFARHVTWLAADFDVRPLSEIVSAFETGRPLPPRACAITFDDGWRDNLEHALPVLEAAGLPATLFAVSDRVGTEGGFWPDETERRLSAAAPDVRRSLAEELGLGSDGASPFAILEFLKGVSEAERPAMLAVLRGCTEDFLDEGRVLVDWDELDRLRDGGFEIEVHGASHAILTGLDEAGVRDELARSLATLRARGHARHGLLAYPSGAYDGRVVDIARGLGYRGAVTTEPGLARADVDALVQPRIGLHEDISRTRREFLRFVPGGHA